MSSGLANIKEMVDPYNASGYDLTYTDESSGIPYPPIISSKSWNDSLGFISDTFNDYDRKSKRELKRLLMDLPLDNQASKSFPPFYHDTDRDSEEIWSWAQRRNIWEEQYTMSSSLVYCAFNDKSRRQAYMMWGRSRLDSPGLTYPPPDDFPNGFSGEFEDDFTDYDSEYSDSGSQGEY
jgi:hypothetical protein